MFLKFEKLKKIVYEMFLLSPLPVSATDSVVRYCFETNEASLRLKPSGCYKFRCITHSQGILNSNT